MTTTSTPTGRLAGRIALVTGASRGIGAAVARRFAREGAQVILVARTQGALEQVDDAIRAEGGQATLCPVDLSKHDDIDRLAFAVAERFGRLDILAANAGMLGILTPLGHLQPKVWDQVMSVNLTANWRLIRAFEPLLKRSDAGRAMFVTSGASRGRFAYWGAYAVSKAALDALVGTWAAETVKTNVRVNLIDPGVVATRMRAEAFPGEDPGKLATPEAVTDTFVELAEAACSRHGEVVRATAG